MFITSDPTDVMLVEKTVSIILKTLQNVARLNPKNRIPFFFKRYEIIAITNLDK